MVTEYQK